MEEYFGFATTENEIHFWFCDENSLGVAADEIIMFNKNTPRQKLNIKIGSKRDYKKEYDAYTRYICFGNLKHKFEFGNNGTYLCYERNYNLG